MKNIFKNVLKKNVLIHEEHTKWDKYRGNGFEKSTREKEHGMSRGSCNQGKKKTFILRRLYIQLK